MVLERFVELLVFAGVVALAPAGTVQPRTAHAEAGKPPGVFRVEAGVAVGAFQEFRDGLGRDVERPQRRVELSKRDEIADGAAVDGRRLGQGHHAVYPCVGHVAAHDGQGRMRLLLRDDGVGELGGVAEAHLDAGEL